MTFCILKAKINRKILYFFFSTNCTPISHSTLIFFRCPISHSPIPHRAPISLSLFYFPSYPKFPQCPNLPSLPNLKSLPIESLFPITPQFPIASLFPIAPLFPFHSAGIPVKILPLPLIFGCFLELKEQIASALWGESKLFFTWDTQFYK